MFTETLPFGLESGDRFLAESIHKTTSSVNEEINRKFPKGNRDDAKKVFKLLVESKTNAVFVHLAYLLAPIAVIIFLAALQGFIAVVSVTSVLTALLTNDILRCFKRKKLADDEYQILTHSEPGYMEYWVQIIGKVRRIADSNGVFEDSFTAWLASWGIEEEVSEPEPETPQSEAKPAQIGG